MILRLYIARRFATASLMVFGGVLFLATLFEALELTRRAGADLDVGVLTLISLAALKAPSISIQAAPYAMMLAAMWTYARLSRSSELVVARAAGISGWALATPVLTTAALFGAFVTTAYNPVSALMLEAAETRAAALFKEEGGLVGVSKQGLWLREGGEAGGQKVIHGRQSRFDGSGISLEGVMVLEFDARGALLRRVDADTARLDAEARWDLSEVNIHERSGSRFETRERPFYDFDSYMTPEQIVESLAAPETVSFWRLPGFIETLENQGFSARRHVLFFNAALATPLVFAAMALLGSAFSMRHVRFGGLGVMALYAALTGFVVYFLLDIAQALAGSGVIDPIAAAWGPPFAALLFAAGLLLQFEDG